MPTDPRLVIIDVPPEYQTPSVKILPPFFYRRLEDNKIFFFQKMLIFNFDLLNLQQPHFLPFLQPDIHIYFFQIESLPLPVDLFHEVGLAVLLCLLLVGGYHVLHQHLLATLQ